MIQRTSSRSGSCATPRVPLPRKRTLTGAFGGSYALSMVLLRLLVNLVAPRNVSPSCYMETEGVNEQLARGEVMGSQYILACKHMFRGGPNLQVSPEHYETKYVLSRADES